MRLHWFQRHRPEGSPVDIVTEASLKGISELGTFAVGLVGDKMKLQARIDELQKCVDICRIALEFYAGGSTDTTVAKTSPTRG